MSDSETDPLRGLLSQFALGPAWARGGNEKPPRKPRPETGGDERPPRRDDRERGPGNRDGGNRDGGRRPFQNRDNRESRGGNFRDRRDGPPQNEEAGPAQGVRVTLNPDNQAVHLIGKEVHQVARVYALFDVAQILLAERGRCRAIFEVEPTGSPLFLGKLDESLFLTRDEALKHLWSSETRAEILEEETIDVDPPTGNFQSVARCGISGEWLGPPNFHSYQTNLRRLHRERFSNMPFEAYAAKVRTERGEEAVNAWLESTKKKTRWRIKGEADDAWIDDRGEAERAIATKVFDKAFAEVRKADVSAAIPAKHLSPSLLTSLRMAGSHARKHPAILIPAICRSLEAEHLPVFKRQGKLHTGPARPHALAADAVLAERPAKMVAWIRENKPAKLEGLWLAVLPEGSTAPPADYAADLFWLLHQGHILLYTDDTLVVQETREPVAPKEPKKPKKPKGPKAEAAAAPVAEPVSDADVSPEANELTSDIAETTTAAEEAPVDEVIPEVSAEAEPVDAEPVSEETPEPEPVAEISENDTTEDPEKPV